VIQQHADDFMLHVVKSCSDYKIFIDQCSKELLNYKKNIHSIVFLERLKALLRANQERHLHYCTLSGHDECRFAKFYKVVLFFLQNELDFQEKDLPFSYFKRSERLQIDQEVEAIVNLLPVLKQSDKNKYIRFRLELNEMKNYYFLDKKNWKQLFLGKVLVMENAHILTHEESTALIERIESVYAF